MLGAENLHQHEPDKKPQNVCPLSYSRFSIFLIYLYQSSVVRSLTRLLCGKEDDEGNDDNEEQGDNSNEADLQGGPSELLSRLGGVSLCHSWHSFFNCRLYQLTYGVLTEMISQLRAN